MAGTVEDLINETYGTPANPAPSDSAADMAEESVGEPAVQAALGISDETYARHRRQIPPYTGTYAKFRDESEIDADTVASLAGLLRAIALLGG